jgi:hypothetical protein
VPNLEYRVAEDVEGGVYANNVMIWHTGHEFTFDFATSLPAVPGEPGGEVTVPFRVVSRVKMPVSLVFEVLKAINANMAKYEASFGELHQIQQQSPGHEPPHEG